MIISSTLPVRLMIYTTNSIKHAGPYAVIKGEEDAVSDKDTLKGVRMIAELESIIICLIYGALFTCLIETFRASCDNGCKMYYRKNRNETADASKR